MLNNENVDTEQENELNQKNHQISNVLIRNKKFSWTEWIIKW